VIKLAKKDIPMIFLSLVLIDILVFNKF